MSNGHPRLTVRLESGLLDRANARAQAEGILVSEMLREALEARAEDVGAVSVMIRLTPYYRGELMRRLRDHPGQA